MNIQENKDHVIISDHNGEYHIELNEYKKLGKDKAINLAKEEIKKKNRLGHYSKSTIDFNQARELGFCEYGIKDFCERLELDIKKEYSVKDLYNALDVHTFKDYPDECLKLFSSKVFEKFGGVEQFLIDNKDRQCLNLVINHGNIDDNILHTLAYKSTLSVINNFEKVYSNDDRPRKAIEAKKLFLDGKINSKELLEARSAARSAAESAWSAVESAAWSAAESAAESAWSAEFDFQINTLITLMRESRNG